MKQPILYTLATALLLMVKVSIFAQGGTLPVKTENIYSKIENEALSRKKPPSGLLLESPFLQDDKKNEFSAENWLKSLDKLHLKSNKNPIFDSKTIFKKMEDDFNKGVVPISIVLTNYETIKPEAIDNEALKKGDLILKKGIIDIYETRQLVMSVPMLSEKILNRQFAFILKQEYIVNNTTKEIKEILIDFGDKKGFQKIKIGQPISVKYNEKGEKSIITKIATNDGNYTMSARVMTQFIATPNHDLSELKFPDKVIELSNAGGGRAYVEYGCKQKLWKPFIFVEGLDFGKSNPIIVKTRNTSDPDDLKLLQYVQQGHFTYVGEFRLANIEIYKYNYQIGDVGFYNLRSGVDLSEDPLKIQQLPCLIDKLKADGFDIVILDFKNNPDKIENNGEVLIELINKLNTELITNGSKHNLVINGASMGGLISRYALKKMENNNQNHNTKLWMTMDSPHFGANIPIGLQKFLTMFTISTDNGITQDLRQRIEAQEALNKLNSDAPKEMLIYHQLGNTNFNSLFSNPNMEFPSKLRKVGIANGSGIGNKQGFGPSNKLAEIDTKKWIFNIDIAEINATSYPGPTTLNFLGVNIPIGTYKPIDSAPGGQRNSIIALDKNPAIDDDVDTYGGPQCFIPTYSSLGIKNPNMDVNMHIKNHLFSNGITQPNALYPYLSIPKNKQNTICSFDNIYFPENNQSHVELTNDNLNFSYNMISPKTLYLENEIIEKNRVEEARNKIIIGEKIVPRNSADLGDWSGKYVINAGGYTILRAGNKIELKPGFKAVRGSVLKAYIKQFECSETSNCW